MKSWGLRLQENLAKTSKSLIVGIKTALHGKRVTDEVLEDVEELLIECDFGIKTTERIINTLSKVKFTDQHEGVVREYLEDEFEKILKPSEVDFDLAKNKLNVILFCGVNGSGKTTTIGKLATKFSKKGKKVLVAACDTFRASATEQLELWCQRAEVQMVKGEKNSDPASIAYKAARLACDDSYDLLLIDTAGRLHNKSHLMAELEKCVKVIKKLDETWPQKTVLVLDGSIGQNSLIQVKEFKKCIEITGVIITKLDGTAKGGVLLAIAEEHQLPIYFIGIGEYQNDLLPFTARAFTQALLPKR